MQTRDLSEYLLKLPFEAYADSPLLRPEDDADKVDGIPRDQQGPDQVGPSTWRKLTSWMSFRKSNLRVHSLPLSVSENPPFKKKLKLKPHRSCCWRLCLRTLLIFFVML